MNRINQIVSIVPTYNEKFVSDRRFMKNSLSNFFNAISRFENASAKEIDNAPGPDQIYSETFRLISEQNLYIIVRLYNNIHDN